MSEDSLRVDKWLWQARFFKTRTLAAKQVAEGKIRVNSTRISKPARAVVVGDTLTFPQGDDVRVIRIEAMGTRRGPAPEAQALYTDLAPPEPRERKSYAERGGARPTKKDRRKLMEHKGNSLD
ncbi:RNA-binding S4 domain-containing protein [Alphaproteobacteria bacterium KMM 3653]|uniref:RNA-binding S4 domain-containing protein n=1 Tax=Harenicola maris TaxID=2841044 RepID=A0AAP2G9T5_9RHOB|nr:RNA-binding S4 domain-containing protein [Harenicola maris]